MDRTDPLVLAAYVAAGIVAVGCAFAPGSSRGFRASCVVLGAFLIGWPPWELLTHASYVPVQVRLLPFAVPVLLVAGSTVAVLRQRRLHRLVGTLPEIEDEPVDPDQYPPEAPLGELSPPHDPWKALYASLARQRAKWESAGEQPPAPGAASAAFGDPITATARRAHGRPDRYAGRHRRSGATAVQEPRQSELMVHTPLR